VAEFLSASWIAEMDRAARDAPSLAPLGAGETLVVEQRVHLGDRDVVYHLAFTSDGARVRAGPAESPDLTVVVDAVTARQLQAGTVKAQQAAVAGRLKIRGNIRRLRAAGDALESVEDVFRAVREATTYPAESEGAEDRRYHRP
jgi:hypothetical protein